MSDLLEGKVELDPTVDFVAGTVAGITSLIVGFPLDTETAFKYRSTFHAFSIIVREERFAGLYKGITSPLASSALMNGLVFASYRFFMKSQLENNESTPSLTQITLAGVGTGIVSSFLTTPIELIKIRQQNCLGEPASVYRTTLQILRTSGIPGLYRGLTSTALRDSGYGAYFFAYEATCRILSPPRTVDAKSLTTGPPWWTLLLAGGVAGVFGWLVTFPFDVVKTRIQGTDRVTSPANLSVEKYNPYRTTVSTIVYSYRAEGMNVFFRGLAPTLLRAIPVNMVTFATFEAVVHALA